MGGDDCRLGLPGNEMVGELTMSDLEKLMDEWAKNGPPRWSEMTSAQKKAWRKRLRDEYFVEKKAAKKARIQAMTPEQRAHRNQQLRRNASRKKQRKEKTSE